MIQQCPMFYTCLCKTAMCRVKLPDESCYWYNYFKKRIQENEQEKRNNYFVGGRHPFSGNGDTGRRIST